MEQGVGGTEEGIRASGGASKSGLVGLRGALESNDPNKIREIANQVKGKYQTSKSHDRHPDNPFGPYSSRFYDVLNRYASAIESGDDEQISAARNHVQQLIDTIDDDSIAVRGAATGMGQAISTPDRTSSVGVASIDAEKGGGESEESSMAGNISSDEHENSWVDPESVRYILDIALNHDIGSAVGHIPKYQKLALDFGGKMESNGSVKIGGKMTANELRYVIRAIGPLGSNYPGNGNVRSNINIPRDAVGWWKPGEDPEIEPIHENTGMWTSKWKREGFQQMGPTEIAQEMTLEVREFESLGIRTARAVKAKIDKKTGRDTSEAVSKVAVHNTLQSALLKLKIIASIHRSNIGMDESLLIKSKLPILENIDNIDRQMILEACNHIIRKIQYTMMEVAPPGWSGTVKAMKKHKEIDNPFALAWWMHRKGKKPHKKPHKTVSESVVRHKLDKGINELLTKTGSNDSPPNTKDIEEKKSWVRRFWDKHKGKIIIGSLSAAAIACLYYSGITLPGIGRIAWQFGELFDNESSKSLHDGPLTIMTSGNNIFKKDGDGFSKITIDNLVDLIKSSTPDDDGIVVTLLRSDDSKASNEARVLELFRGLGLGDDNILMPSSGY